MKTIGLVGGMSWESSLHYYRLINQGVRERLGGLHSAKCVLVSVDFAEIEALQMQSHWDEAADAMVQAAQQAADGGADCILICTNTMHKVAQQVQDAIPLPFIHIADATAQAIKQQGLTTVGLLGTRFTMEETFYRGRLEDIFGLQVLVPNADDRTVVNRVIYEELVVGQVQETSRAQYRRVIQALVEAGAQGIILGCTEIGLLVKQQDSPVPLFDTTQIHAQAALDFALS